MDKKEILKSINEIDDKLLIEGEEFFTPEEPQENLSIYRKKGISLKPIVSVAACAAVVVAVAIFAANLVNLPESYSPNSENPDNTPISDEGADITILEPMTEATEETTAESTENTEKTESTESEQTTEETQETNDEFDNIPIFKVKTSMPDEFGASMDKSGYFVNISQPTPFTMTNTYYVGNVEEPYPVRLFVLKDGVPTDFSTETEKNVTWVDMTFTPNTNMKFSPSFTIDENDRFISIYCMLNPDSVDAEETYIEQTDFINLGCNETPEYDEKNGEFTDEQPYNSYISVHQDHDECYLLVDVDRGSCYLTVYVNGEPSPLFNAVAKGDYTIAVKSDGLGKTMKVKLDKSFIHSGDIVQATAQYIDLEDSSMGFSYYSHRIQMQ